MTKKTIKEIEILLETFDSNQVIKIMISYRIENYLNASFTYWEVSKLIYEHLINVYAYNSEKADWGYILYQKEAFKIFNDNLHYMSLAVQQKNIKIKSYMLAHTKMLENFIYLKSFFKDLQGEYITTTPKKIKQFNRVLTCTNAKKIKQFNQVLTCTNAFILIIEKRIKLLEESAKKLERKK